MQISLRFVIYFDAYGTKELFILRQFSSRNHALDILVSYGGERQSVRQRALRCAKMCAEAPSGGLIASPHHRRPECLLQGTAVECRSPWSDMKVSVRAGHILSPSLRPAAVGRATEMPCPFRRLSCHSKETFSDTFWPAQNHSIFLKMYHFMFHSMLLKNLTTIPVLVGVSSEFGLLKLKTC